MSKLLSEGTEAPDFTLPDQNGKMVSLKNLRGKKVLLFFYPEDDTPTCTIQACNLRDNYSALKKADYQVLGISPDDSKSHQKFIAKFELPYTLLADPDKKVLNLYGVWDEKIMFGRKYMGVKRITYIINEQGVIERIIRGVRSKIHSQQVLGK